MRILRIPSPYNQNKNRLKFEFVVAQNICIEDGVRKTYDGPPTAKPNAASIVSPFP